MSETEVASSGSGSATLGDEIVGRIDALGTISEAPEHLTRIFLSPEHRTAADLILSWMRMPAWPRISTPSATSAAAMKATGRVCRA